MEEDYRGDEPYRERDHNQISNQNQDNSSGFNTSNDSNQKAFNNETPSQPAQSVSSFGIDTKNLFVKNEENGITRTRQIFTFPTNSFVYNLWVKEVSVLCYLKICYLK